MKNKRVTKIVEKAVQASFSSGKVEQKKVTYFINAFKKLNLADAILALTQYSKGLKSEIERHTLTVESPIKLDSTQLRKIENTFKKDYQISKTENIINSSLLGGFRVKIADTIFDNSLKSKIAQVKEAIRG